MAVEDHIYLKRNGLEALRQRLGDFRIVVINGPRQSGKTVLLRQLHQLHGGTFVNLDEADLRAAALADPVGLIAGAPRPIYVDEVQRAGNALILAIKSAVDRDRTPGQFVLAGSTRFLTVPALSESLAGRAAIVDLWPFSQGELIKRTETFVDRLFGDPRPILRQDLPALDRVAYMERLCAGGFPEAVSKSTPRGRSVWFDAYVRTVTMKDIEEFTRIRQADELPHLLRALGAQTAQELNIAQLARSTKFSESTLRNYLPLLETVYLIHRVSGWSRNLTAKQKRRPKLHLTDSGLAAWLQGADATALARPTSRGAGPLLETFVVGEIRKQIGWSGTDVSLHHLRDRDGLEIDLLLEARDGRVVGIEVKAGQTISDDDFRWLRRVSARLGEQFAQGIVLHTGTRSLSFGDDLMALPVCALWEA